MRTTESSVNERISRSGTPPDGLATPNPKNFSADHFRRQNKEIRSPGNPRMGLAFAVAIAISLTFVLAILIARRWERARLGQRLADVAKLKQSGGFKARLQYPHIDLSRCIGCGTCIAACPEDDVIDLIHGQASIVHGSRCVGHGRCAAACPVGGISLTLADIRERTDLPALNRHNEARGTPGLFLAGEVTGYALIRTAISQGTAIIDRIMETSESTRTGDSRSPHTPPELDVVIVGAGPAGLAASLRAKQLGLAFVTLEQAELGGTVSKYPRQKLVMTQPVHLPLHGRLNNTTYSKEQLLELWTGIVRKYDLPILTGEEFVNASRDDDGFVVRTKSSEFRCRNVCLCVGRRGTPRKLGVPGENHSKVAYNLIDAHSYQNRRILVVGGGDSAVEAAIGLSYQPGNRVSLSYRGQDFTRIKSRNQAALTKAIASGQLECLLGSEVRGITDGFVRLEISGANRELPNDEVFVMIGGIAPFELLAKSGVSFDPEDREVPPPITDQGTGLLAALLIAVCFALAMLGWVIWFREYYQLPSGARPLSNLHSWLRPSGTLGLGAGVAASAMILANLCYLVRRNRLGYSIPGSLATWMTSHVATGILAFLLVLIHAAFAPRNTVGGHAFVALAVLVISGAVGRYFYSFVPRAANGKELELDEIELLFAADSAEWDVVGREFHDRVREEIQELVASVRWKSSLFSRLIGLIQTNAGIREKFRTLRTDCLRHGLTEEQTRRVLELASRAYKTALGITHFEDLRGILNTWRFLHRWVALLMILTVIAHVLSALKYTVHNQ